MTAQNKTLLVVLLIIVVVVTAAAFVALYILPQSERPREQPTAQQELSPPSAEFQNPFAEENINPFSEKETYQNPFESTKTGERNYQNPFEAIQ